MVGNMKTKTNKSRSIKNLSESKEVTQQLHALASTMMMRQRIASGLGQSFGGSRDIYSACGYKKELEWGDYYNRYTRQGIAKRVVNSYPNACWRLKPDVYETSEDTETEFEKAWDSLVKDKRAKLFYNLKRVDVLAGIGEYGILLIGFDDNKPLSEEVTDAKEILYLQPYMECDASITALETDIHNERFGLPLTYTVSVKTPVGSTSGGITSQIVHWSRIVHIAEGCESDDIYGTPRMQEVMNNLQNIETIESGSAEMFWQGAFPGIVFKADADADMTTQTKELLQTEIEEWQHGLRRYMRMQGIEPQSLSPQVSDPTGHILVQVQAISGAKGIPQRVLLGSEQAQLASSQDKENWLDRVDERRKDFCETNILREFIARCQSAGVLPKTADRKYIVEWPDIYVPDAQAKATVAVTRTQALAAYVGGGVDALIAPQSYLTIILGMTDEEAEKVLEDAELYMQEQEEEQAEEAEEQVLLNPPVQIDPKTGQPIPANKPQGQVRGQVPSQLVKNPPVIKGKVEVKANKGKQ